MGIKLETNAKNIVNEKKTGGKQCRSRRSRKIILHVFTQYILSYFHVDLAYSYNNSESQDCSNIPLVHIWVDGWHGGLHQNSLSTAVIQSPLIMTQFLMGFETDKLVVDKENILSHIGTDMEKHVHVYL